jgi:hypothetical protein
MVAVAIFSIDPGLRRDLEKLPGEGPTQVIQRLHGQLHRFTANDGCNIHAAAP